MGKTLFQRMCESTKEHLEPHGFEEINVFHNIRKEYRSQEDPFLVKLRQSQLSSIIYLKLQLNKKEVDDGKPHHKLACDYLSMLEETLGERPITPLGVVPLDKETVELRYRIQPYDRS